MTFTYDYDAPSEIAIGNVYYMIRICDVRDYRNPCKVCNGTHSVTVNGVTFSCPVCDRGDIACRVNAYYVKRYRVCGIEVNTNHDDWKPSNRRSMTIKLYHKTGRGSYAGNIEIIERPLSDFVNGFNSPDLNPYVLERRFFDNYALACKTAAALTDIQKEKLREYNAKNGTDFQFVQSTENDKKSV